LTSLPPMRTLLIFSILLIIGCTKKEDAVILPVSPTDLTASVASTTQVNLSWTDKSTNETGFKIQRKTSSTSFMDVGTVGKDVTSFSDVGLTPNTTYTYRVYAYNSGGSSITYTNEVSVTTWAPAQLQTNPVTSIAATSAVSGANITSDGGTSITARGIVWSTAPNPTISLTTRTTDGTGIGSFSSSLIGLTPNTTYFVRAYATNSAGTAYGNEVTFKTSNIDIVTGLVAFYPFNGNAGDSSGNNNHGIVNGAILTTDRFGNTNKAYEFNGQGSIIKVAKTSLIEPQSELTVSCWFYANYAVNQGSDAVNSATQILRKGSAYGYGYHLSWSNLGNKKLESHYLGSWGKLVHGVPNEQYKNKWYLVTMTYSLSSRLSKLYIDGNMVSISSCSQKLEHSDILYIGGFENFQYFTGKIDDVRIYNRALTDEEIIYLSKQ